jgi:hypothetical protein
MDSYRVNIINVLEDEDSDKYWFTMEFYDFATNKFLSLFDIVCGKKHVSELQQFIHNVTVTSESDSVSFKKTDGETVIIYDKNANIMIFRISGDIHQCTFSVNVTYYLKIAFLEIGEIIFQDQCVQKNN